MLRVNAGIDDPADGAPHFVLEAPIITVGILIKTNFLSQAFGAERPAFRVGIEIEGKAAERRQVREFLCDRELQVVAGMPS